MPLDAQHGWRRTGMVTAAEILEQSVTAEVKLTPRDPAATGLGTRQRSSWWPTARAPSA